MNQFPLFSLCLIVFVVSLLGIRLELFLTRILNLKAWSHLVYIIIPFAILGYGIGANLCLIFRNYFLKRWDNRRRDSSVGRGNQKEIPTF